jgi:hypothetical protein
MTRGWRAFRRGSALRAGLLLLGIVGLWTAACAARRTEPAARAVATDPLACVEPAAADEPSLGASSGRLSPERIEQVATGELPALRVCYERVLARSRNVAGQINVHFVIGVDGRVSHVRAEHNNVPDCDAVRCVLDVFRGLHFPAPEGGSVHVLYPILLAPG